MDELWDLTREEPNGDEDREIFVKDLPIETCPKEIPAKPPLIDLFKPVGVGTFMSRCRRSDVR